MSKVLQFNLKGMIASWGDVAIAGYRPSFNHPTRSAIIGLINSALGNKREDTQLTCFSIAVKVNKVGDSVRDYHTTQVPHVTSKSVFLSRKSELEATQLKTILSDRAYFTDVSYTIGIKADEQTLNKVKQALNRPKHLLYLGRKSCPLTEPMNPIIKEKDETVFDYWDSNFYEKHPTHSLVVTKRDEPVSRARWQFKERLEYCL